ncbi:MAG: hypothetical protein ACI9FB_000965 [Candidatus Azotimanducaceae bacterium]|jgi:hypothetical protein
MKLVILRKRNIRQVNFLSFLLAIFGSTLCTTVQAVTVDDLYVANVYVTSQSASELKSGARAGLIQVLTRVSGSSTVQQHTIVSKALRNPSPYYYQYSYQSTEKEFQIGDEIVAATNLRLRFEPNAIAQLLRSAGFPVWGSNRPSILLWIALNDGQERRLLSELDHSELTAALSMHAKLRGLPLLYPLLDLEDNSSISTAEVWGAFLGRVEEASRRYNPDAMLSARIQKSEGGEWSGNWYYQIDGEWQEFENFALTAEELVLELVDMLVVDLAAQYAVDSSESFVELRVEGVDSLKDYSAISKYLQSLTPVLDTYVALVDQDEVVFQLKTEGRVEQLIEIIGLDTSMMLLNGSAKNQKLYYRWLL